MQDDLHHKQIRRLIDQALDEDIGSGDITTNWTIPSDAKTTASFIAREQGIIAGIAVTEMTFLSVDPSLEFTAQVNDGDQVMEGQSFAEVTGSARAILTGERTALNFIRRLSGIATITNQYVQAVAGTGTAIVDTRKTTPGHRYLEKAAVKAGGGINHRFGLYDMVLIKDNHIAAAGGITAAVITCREQMRACGRIVEIEVEVADMQQVAEAVSLNVDQIMLDNMTDDQMRDATAQIRKDSISEGRPRIEASGAINLSRVRAVAETGVDIISIGALTHSAPALDISLNIA